MTAADTVGALLALAAVAGRGPHGRPPVCAERRERPPEAPRAAAGEPDLAGTLLAVAAQLRAGLEPIVAWQVTLGARPATSDGLVAALVAGASAAQAPGARWVPRAVVGSATRRRTSSGRRPSPALLARARAAAAAVRVADELGAPLAPALESIARAVAADEEDEADRGAALAGPRATARLLAWLPLLGLGLAAVLGAHPVAVVLDGGLGTALGASGGVLVLVGRWWTARLVARAERGASRDARRRSPRRGVRRGPGRRASW